MPVQLSYPGVYLQEIPSGVRSITGVSTSLTAFIGRALKGATNKAILITSYADFERRFGGLWYESTMSYCVRDFFLNGGSQALIVRIEKDAASATLDVDVLISPPENLLIFKAASPGEWGNKISIQLDFNVVDPKNENLFNLMVYYKNSEDKDVQVERHLNVSLIPSDIRFLPKVLKNSSSYLLIDETQEGSGIWNIPQGRPYINTSSNKFLKGGSDGVEPEPTEYNGSDLEKSGLFALKYVDYFNLLCVPPPARLKNTDPSVYSQALAICVEQRAVLLMDPPIEWGVNPANAVDNAKSNYLNLGVSGSDARNAALFFPCIIQPDPLRDNQLDTFVPCGMIAGLIAKNDASYGVWNAPAGIKAGLSGISGLQVNLIDKENGVLNPLGINCLRNLPGVGRVVWGARTMRGADIFADEYKYLPVERMKLFLQQSLYWGLQWVVFEPNDEPLWSQIRLNVGAFMHSLYVKGAFQGRKNGAYFVKCDSETTTQTDINLGIVNIVVGFQPLKPAEFVVMTFQQIAGKIET
ncbi:MAG: phage tail sheath family protein [Saprospiraceae bacterium]